MERMVKLKAETAVGRVERNGKRRIETAQRFEQSKLVGGQGCGC